MRSYGFTLLELLIVIAVVAVLVALSVPGLSTVKGYGKRTACLNNLKQINNARDVVSFVDGHASYIKMYWDAVNVTKGHLQACMYNPPAGYDYQWSGD